MLSSTGLMNGNWVNVTIEGETFPAIVTKIDSYTEEIRVSFLGNPNDWEESDSFDDINPIPLTTEIVEKNDFEKEYGGAWPIYRHRHNKWLVLYKKEFGFMVNISGAERKIEFVHELQLLFKLCKINDDVEV